MTNKLKYSILPDKSLIIEYYRGNFHVDELIDFKRKVGTDRAYNPNYNVISDIREVDFLFKINEVTKYVKFLSENQKHIGNRKTAMITMTPNQVITSLGFDIRKDKMPILFKVFSTLETACAFIGLSIDDCELVDMLINKLKNTP